MNISKYVLMATFCLSSAVSNACPEGVYKSTLEDVYLHLSNDLTLEIHRGSDELVYSGAIQEFSMDSEYEWFKVVPDENNLGNIGEITLGGTCEFIKIFWWQGEEGKSTGTKYFMKRIPNKKSKFTPPQAAPRDALSTRPLAWRYVYKELEGR